MRIVKQALLTLLSALIIFLFFRIKIYNEWITTIINDEKKISIALNQLDPEMRKTEWWGTSYIISKNILNYFRQNKFDEKNALILMPPNEYVITNKVDFAVPEPSKFYYYTGLKTVWANSPLAEKANYVVAIEDRELIIIPVPDKNALNTYLSEFRKYQITL